MIDFSSLFTILSNSWIGEVFTSLGLTILGAVFNIVSYTFKLFTLMCQINFTSLYSIISPLVDRLEALVMVLILFKGGMALIGYLMNPDSFVSDGTKLLKNIAITTALLLSYNFIFGVLNELSMLIIGNSDGYQFTRLPDIVDIDESADSGLIARFIFGETDIDMDLGDFVAYNTIAIFVQASGNELDSTILDGEEIDFTRLSNISPYVNKTVTYIPLIGTIMGGFIIYSIAKACIEIGIRMFKLIVLQILAPVAIVSIIKDGTKGKTFSGFVSTYIKTYLEAFVRMASMLIIVVFISKFILNLPNFFSESALANEENVLTKGLLLAIIIVAGFKFAGELPKFIDGIIGTHMADSKGGFGTFVKGLVGGTAGVITGIGAGLSAGGIGNALYNGIAGGINGASSAAKGKTIAETVKNIGENNNKNRTNAQNIARQGGILGSIEHACGNLFGIRKTQQMNESREKDNLTAYNNMVDVRSKALSSRQSGHEDKSGKGIKYGDSADAYAAKLIEYDSSVQKARMDYEKGLQDPKADSATVQALYDTYIDKRDTATSAYKDEYEKALFNDDIFKAREGYTDSGKRYTEEESIYLGEIRQKTRDYNNRADKEYKAGAKEIKKTREYYSGNISKYHGKHANQVDQRQGSYGGK